MHKLFAATIWAPGAIPPEEWKYRNLKRVMFPVIDLLFFIAGIYATIFSVPAISSFFSNEVVDFFALTLSFSAALAFIGMSIPRLWPIEMVAKSILLGLMSAYVLALIINTIFLTSPLDVQGNRGFVILIAMVSLCPIVWKLTMLGSEWQVRRIRDKVHRVIEKGV